MELKNEVDYRTTHAQAKPHPHARGINMAQYLLSTLGRYIKPLSLARANSTAAEVSSELIKVCGKEYKRDCMTNVTPAILERTGRNLHRTPHHPITILKERIVHHFHTRHVNRVGNPLYVHIDDVPPVVTTEQNFDSLYIPPDHISRQKQENYYINSTHLLRAHTSAHQRDFIKMGLDKFLLTGDVYRRDNIDSKHYPVFHQMEGVALLMKEELFKSSGETLEILEQQLNEMIETDDKQATHTIDGAKMTELNLKAALEDLIRDLFGNDIETRWTSCYFPFTHPSYELEIKYKGEWLEVLGSGVMRQEILEQGGASHKIGWAFGLGLDRLAMLLFNIEDIRILWTTNERFINQFKNVGLDPATNIVFQKYSLLPPQVRDIAFWINDKAFSEKDFYDTVRDMCGDVIEKVELTDTFTHPTSGRSSHCYRLVYCCTEGVTTRDDVNELQANLRRELPLRHDVELR